MEWRPPEKISVQTELKRHIKEEHTTETHNCDSCKFMGNNKIDLAWHMEAIHQKKDKHTQKANKDERDVCKFWMRGFCKFPEDQCRFKHYGVKRCYQGNNCLYWPNCRYSHYNGSDFEMCRYQSRCRRNDCPYQHVEQNFLEGNLGWGANWGVPDRNMVNFPPLMSQEAPWRPW